MWHFVRDTVTSVVDSKAELFIAWRTEIARRCGVGNAAVNAEVASFPGPICM